MGKKMKIFLIVSGILFAVMSIFAAYKYIELKRLEENFNREDLSFEQFLHYTAIKTFGNEQKGRTKFIGITELSNYTGNIGIVLQASPAFSVKSIIQSCNDEMFLYLREAIKDEEFRNQDYFGIAFMEEIRDKYGNIENKYILTAKFKLTELKKVNWENISGRDMSSLATEYWMHEALKD